MFRKTILPVILAVAFAGAFSSNASALTAKGKFAKKAHKIKGSWFLVEVEGHQVIAFDKKFETQDGTDLKILLSKKKLSKLKKNPSLTDPIALARLKDTSGEQHYVLPASINLADYKSILIHSEEANLLWGGFNMPEESDEADQQDALSRVIENNEGAIRTGL